MLREIIKRLYILKYGLTQLPNYGLTPLGSKKHYFEQQILLPAAPFYDMAVRSCILSVISIKIFCYKFAYGFFLHNFIKNKADMYQIRRLEPF